MDLKWLFTKVTVGLGCSDRWDAHIGWMIGVVFTPLAIVFGCHLINHFVCDRME